MSGNESAEENCGLLQFLIEKQAKFKAGMIYEQGGNTPVVIERVRRAMTLNDLGPFQSLITVQIKMELAGVTHQINYEVFPVGDIEVQATASGDGDYFRMHRDSDGGNARELTFVYYVFREPQRFSGGELRLSERDFKEDRMVTTDRLQTIPPRQKVDILFPNRHVHAGLPTRVSSKEFADSRFAITAWIHRGKG